MSINAKRSYFHGMQFSWNREWLLYVLIVMTSFLLHHGALDGHWRWDDTQALRQIFEYGSIASFVDTNIYNYYSTTNLFPWLLLSKEIDLWLFGPEPFWFYLHQFFAITIASICLYLVGKQWMRKEFSFLAAILFLSGPPLTDVSEQLMTRHYIEGLVFALISLYTFTRSIESSNKLYLTVSVVCYALAVTGKEVYVPLVLLLPFIPKGSFEARIRLVLPFVVLAVLYVFWREYMLINLLGGHAGSYSVDLKFLIAVVSDFINIPNLLFPNFLWISVLLCVVIVLSGIIASRANSVLFLYVAALIMAPLIPLVAMPGLNEPDRYFLVPWVGISFMIPYCAEKIFDTTNKFEKPIKGLTVIALVMLVSISIFNSRERLIQDLGPWTNEFDTFAEFLLENDSSIAYIPGSNIQLWYAYVIGIKDILPYIGRANELPVAIIDPIYLNAEHSTVYSYNADCHCMTQESELALERLKHGMNDIRDEQLSIELQYQLGFLSWEFGPYPAGEYRLVSPLLGSIRLPPRGSQPVNSESLGWLSTPFFLKYSSPEGWVTYSPELTLGAELDDPTTQLSWQRVD